jgi:hypothetical protein
MPLWGMGACDTVTRVEFYQPSESLGPPNVSCHSWTSPGLVKIDSRFTRQNPVQDGPAPFGKDTGWVVGQVEWRGEYFSSWWRCSGKAGDATNAMSPIESVTINADRLSRTGSSEIALPVRLPATVRAEVVEFACVLIDPNLQSD